MSRMRERAVAAHPRHHLAHLLRRHVAEPGLRRRAAVRHVRQEEAEVAGRHIGERMGPVFEHALVHRERLLEIAAAVLRDPGPEDVMVRPLDHVDGVDLHVAEVRHRRRGRRRPGAERRRRVEPLRGEPDAPRRGGAQRLDLWSGNRHREPAGGSGRPVIACLPGRASDNPWTTDSRIGRYVVAAWRSAPRYVNTRLQPAPRSVNRQNPSIKELVHDALDPTQLPGGGRLRSCSLHIHPAGRRPDAAPEDRPRRRRGAGRALPERPRRQRARRPRPGHPGDPQDPQGRLLRLRRLRRGRAD